MVLIDKLGYCKLLFIVHVLSHDAQDDEYGLSLIYPEDSLPYYTCT